MKKINIKYAGLYSSLEIGLKELEADLQDVEFLLKNPKEIGYIAFDFASKEKMVNGMGYATHQQLHKARQAIEILKLIRKQFQEKIEQIKRIQKKLIDKSNREEKQ